MNPPSPGHRRVVVPAYFHPAVAPDDWVRLIGHAPSLRAVILNVDSGPGRALERSLHGVASRVAAAGGQILGYVDTAYGARPGGAVQVDLAQYHSGYPVSGVFLDRVNSQSTALGWYRWIVDCARSVFSDVVLNPGTYPHPGYAEIADALVTFEGPCSAYRDLRVPEWTYDHPPQKFWHLVYDTPAVEVDRVLRRAANANVGAIYVTEAAGANPWCRLPSSFADQISVWSSMVAGPVAGADRKVSDA